MQTSASPPPASSPDPVALDEIQALLSSPDSPHNPPLAATTAIVQRTGRPYVPARPIDVCTSETRQAYPPARVASEGTCIEVMQDPHGPGLHVRIDTVAAADSKALQLTVDGRRVFPAAPTPARPWPGRVLLRNGR